MTPVEISSRSGALDVIGNVSNTSCTCANNNAVFFSVSNGDSQLSRWLSVLMTSRLTGQQVKIYSNGECVAGWFALAQDQGYAIDLL